MGLCAACERRKQRNGACDCGASLFKVKRDPWRRTYCPRCHDEMGLECLTCGKIVETGQRWQCRRCYRQMTEQRRPRQRCCAITQRRTQCVYVTSLTRVWDPFGAEELYVCCTHLAMARRRAVRVYDQPGRVVWVYGAPESSQNGRSDG